DARYDRGLPYECLRTRSTSAGLLTPSPSRNLPGNASASDFWQADIVTASRAYTFAMPVATFSVDVSDKSSVASTNGSRPVVSLIHNAPKPMLSSACAAWCACVAGTPSSAAVQIPTRPTSTFMSATYRRARARPASDRREELDDRLVRVGLVLHAGVVARGQYRLAVREPLRKRRGRSGVDVGVARDDEHRHLD